jgi:hypothetical protein
MKRSLRAVADAVGQITRPKSSRHVIIQLNPNEVSNSLINREERDHLGNCPSCGSPMESGRTGEYAWSHNVQTCRLVNLALAEIGFSLSQPILVNVYAGRGPLKGFYFPADPFTIHISEDAYYLFPEYTVFHETKHLVDCLTKGWSEEASPDPWARSLCLKYGFRYPPPYQYVDYLGLSLGYRPLLL